MFDRVHDHLSWKIMEDNKTKIHSQSPDSLNIYQRGSSLIFNNFIYENSQRIKTNKKMHANFHPLEIQAFKASENDIITNLPSMMPLGSKDHIQFPHNSLKRNACCMRTKCNEALKIGTWALQSSKNSMVIVISRRKKIFDPQMTSPGPKR